MKTQKNIFSTDKLSTFGFYISILLFIIAFNFQHNPPGGWYQQFLPDLGGRQISDVFFLDSLTGWAVTSFTQQNDTVYLLKTSNGGDNWFINYTGAGQFVGMRRIYFLNDQTGYACGNGFNNTSQNNFAKTTNSGVDWFSINPPDPFEVYHDFSVLNEDTIWLISSNSPTGGVFRTTNGGASWILQSSPGIYPDKIYMFNERIGFTGFNEGTPTTQKTTNGGFNWFTVINEGFTDIYFIDSLTGWRAAGPGRFIKKTTDGGINWIMQNPPSGGNIYVTPVFKISNVNEDTIWGVGGMARFGNNYRGIIYNTTNGGANWGYQLPDTSISVDQYYFVEFTDRLHGWSYSTSTGIHTTKGGDTTIYTSIKQLSSEIPTDFRLNQNYPNPFNPTTTIVFEVKNSKVIKLIINDITGREISVLVNEKLNAGSYRYLFNAGSLSSGIYFYSLIIDGKKVDTKKMILVR